MKTSISFKILVILILFTGCTDKKSTTEQTCELVPGKWRFHSHIGSYIDKISEQRIMDAENWEIIYPETEKAFELREDDKNYPKVGRWRGEFWGKYMLSVVAAARYYESEELKTRIATAVEGFLQHQEENGYLGTYEHSDFLVGNNWNVWCRKYTLWGLLECYSILGDEKILDAAVKFADHLISEVGPDAVDIVMTGNFYGMPSMSILQPMVMLYNATGNDKYLNYSEYIIDRWTTHPEGLPDILNKGLSKKPVQSWFPKKDPYNWAKGYELTSCIEGMVKLYKVTRNPDYLLAAENIHEVMVKYERTPVGSVSFNDKFIGSAGLINTVAEICDAVYWNRLSFELYTTTGKEKYVDEMERTLYNSLLCAFNSEGTWGLRRLRTSHLHIPAPNHFLHHHQCCTDNLPRGLYQAAEFALMKNDINEVFISLFNEGEGEIELDQDVISFKIQNDFLEGEVLNVIVTLEEPKSFLLNIRKPRWSESMSLTINGEEFSSNGPGHWFKIDREWANNDVIEVNFRLKARWESFDIKLFDFTWFHEIGYYDTTWANMKFLGGTYEPNNEKYKYVDALNVEEALPHKKAITFFYGPIALSRDIRVSGADVFSSIPDSVEEISVSSVQAPEDIWKIYKIDIGDGKPLTFCDFSSAGNTWDSTSLFNTWCLLRE